MATSDEKEQMNNPTVSKSIMPLKKRQAQKTTHCTISFYNRNGKKNNGCLGPGLKGRLTANEQGEFFR